MAVLDSEKHLLVQDQCLDLAGLTALYLVLGLFRLPKAAALTAILNPIQDRGALLAASPGLI